MEPHPCCCKVLSSIDIRVVRGSDRRKASLIFEKSTLGRDWAKGDRRTILVTGRSPSVGEKCFRKERKDESRNRVIHTSRSSGSALRTPIAPRQAVIQRTLHHDIHTQSPYAWNATDQLRINSVPRNTRWEREEADSAWKNVWKMWDTIFREIDLQTLKPLFDRILNIYQKYRRKKNWIFLQTFLKKKRKKTVIYILAQVFV